MIADGEHRKYKTTMKLLIPTLVISLAAAPLAAHPHIFIDTGLDLYFDSDGALSEVRVTWSYDAFYSLLITQDFGLDLDGDGLLTDAELSELQGFDMNWTDGFDGDLEARAGGLTVPLSAPRDYSATFVLGRITTFHTRDVLARGLSADLFQFTPRDPTYYTAYDVTYPVTLHGIDGCKALVKEPQKTEALLALQDQLSGLAADADPVDVGLPNAGAALATTVTVSCRAS